MHVLMGLGFTLTGLMPLFSKAFRDATLPDMTGEQLEAVLEKSELEEANL
jgi:hypothetical protein